MLELLPIHKTHEELFIIVTMLPFDFHVNIFPFQMEMENQQLKMTNLKQGEQILLLQDKLQSNPTCFFFFVQ